MPTLNEMFPSQYLCGDDLGDKSYALRISRVVTEQIFDKREKKKARKWVVYFNGAKKGCLIGKEQAKVIMLVTNSKTSEEWIGKVVGVHAEWTKAYGEDHFVPRFGPVTKQSSGAAPEAMNQDSIDDGDEQDIDQGENVVETTPAEGPVLDFIEEMKKEEGAKKNNPSTSRAVE